MYPNFPRVKLLGTTGTFRKGKNWIHRSILFYVLHRPGIWKLKVVVTAEIGTNKRGVRAEMLFSFLIKPTASVVACAAPFVNLVRGFAL